MKIPAEKKLNIGARRTLTTISNGMMEMLTEKNLEDIRVGELCEKIMIPRATFYNYFYDKYDVVEYILEQIENELMPPVEAIENHTITLAEIIDDMFDYFEKRKDLIIAIFKRNPEGSSFFKYFSNMMVESANELMMHCVLKSDYDIPLEIVTKMEASAVLIVFCRMYLERIDMSRDEIHHILERVFIKTINNRTPFS